LLLLALGIAFDGVGWSRGWLIGSTNQLFLGAAVAMASLLLAVEALARWAGTSFLYSVIIGEDGRTSTSKTFVLMWTLLVGWALIALLFAGQILVTHSCVTDKLTPKCANDGIGLLQLDWRTFLQSGLDTSYMVLLGIPAAAALAAKAVTENAVAARTLPTRPLSPDDKAFPARIAQIFSADDGTTDIGDFQYVLFNLILAVYFVSGLLNLSSTGLPVIPATILGLTSVSAALYVGKKAATRVKPTINAVIPSLLVPTGNFLVLGSDLTDDATSPNPQPPIVMINGQRVENTNADGADRITGTVPGDLNPGTDQIPGTVVVVSPFGYETTPFTVTIKGR